MDPACLSRAFQVRKLTPCDTDAILSLMRGNHIFFRHHPPAPTRESIAEDMAALPPGKTCADKLYVGFLPERLSARRDGPDPSPSGREDGVHRVFHDASMTALIACS